MKPRIGIDYLQRLARIVVLARAHARAGSRVCACTPWRTQVQHEPRCARASRIAEKARWEARMWFEASRFRDGGPGPEDYPELAAALRGE